MATQYTSLDDKLTKFINEQHMFFVGTAAQDGRVNVSPKGMDSLRVLGTNRIIWLNLTGSGNETAGHLAAVNRMTLMWCSYTLKPMIMRCYGTARTIHTDHEDWQTLSAHFPDHPGARQVYDMDIDLVQTSCGFAVPRYDHVADRDTLTKWTLDKGEGGLRQFAKDNSLTTIDGLPTGTPLP